jgi:circadian clock protein KaiB
MSGAQDATLKRFEDRISGPDDTRYEFTLFVSGATDLSARAIANASQLCESRLHGRYHLLVIDVHEDLAAVLGDGVVATPTLVKNRPLPVRKLVGDLSHTDKVLLALELPVAHVASNQSG